LASGIPCALLTKGAREIPAKLGRMASRDRGDMPSRRRPRMRAIQYAAASRLDRRRLWNTGSPAFAGDDIGEELAV
jgi:hypothetical protein